MKEVEIIENSPEKENAQQKKADRELRDHIAGLDKTVLLVQDPFAPLRRIYGRDGKYPADVELKKEYDEVVIPASDTLDDDMITAIMIGSALDPSRLDREMTGSSFAPGATTYIGFNRIFLFENMKEDEKKRMIFCAARPIS